MKAKQPKQLIYLILVSMAFFASNIQASRLVDGSLGNWITQHASPKRGEILNYHPRFKGERIRIMATRDGQPMPVTDQLTDLIREQLIEDLLSIADVRIVFDETHRCNPIRVNTVLGIEIQKHGSREHRISLVMVDIEEGIWLNGTNVFWHGRLSNAQRRAFNTRLHHRSTSSVFDTAQTAEIAQALYAQMQCNGAVAAPIFIEEAENDLDRKVLRKLIRKISSRGLITLDKEAAASIIKLRHTHGEFSLELVSNDHPEQSLQIAEVEVTETATTTTHALKHDPLYMTPPDILSEIRLTDHHSKDRVCRRNKENCVDISFEIYQSAYLVLFYTLNGQVAPVSCELPARQRPGRLYYGLNIPAGDSSTRPTLGFYALAFKGRSTAHALHKALKKSSPRCHGRHLSRENWVAAFRHLLDEQPDAPDWRAIHLTRSHDRTTIL